MLEYLICLPSEVLGHSMLGFLDLIDIIQLENAAASRKSQQFIKSIFPYCPPENVMCNNLMETSIFNRETINWYNKKRFRVELVQMDVEMLSKIDFEYCVLDNIMLNIKANISLEVLAPLWNPINSKRITQLEINQEKDPALMEVVFGQLHNVQKLKIIDDLSQWINPIRLIGHGLKEITIKSCYYHQSILISILGYCPFIEKLCLSYESFGPENSILQSIANYCAYLRYLRMGLCYQSSADADADLTAFAEKCPQLEELSLGCFKLTDQCVIALAQHCARLKRLSLEYCKLTVVSLIALSERGLSLEELDIPNIPIPNAEIAAQCAHALSRIREHYTYSYDGSIRFMTGLRKLELSNLEDHLLVPCLLQGHCAGLENLTIGPYSSITPEQICHVLRWCINLNHLHTVCITKATCITNAVLVELAHSCPRVQVTLYSTAVTEESVLALAVHCRQLREIHIPMTTVTEETVRQLAQHCRHLTKLFALVTTDGQRTIRQDWSWKQLSELRETSLYY